MLETALGLFITVLCSLVVAVLGIAAIMVWAGKPDEEGAEPTRSVLQRAPEGMYNDIDGLYPVGELSESSPLASAAAFLPGFVVGGL